MVVILEDDYHSGYRNVSHCHQQFFSELHSPGWTKYLDILHKQSDSQQNIHSSSFVVVVVLKLNNLEEKSRNADAKAAETAKQVR